MSNWYVLDDNHKPVKVPMLKSPIAPDFDAFLVIPEASFGCFAPRKDDPQPAWKNHDWSGPQAARRY